ncbi:glycosyltransferase family 2 protein [Selenomonas ruminantium]|uniref:Glycosyltransferase involved in cell wall bisynthesis n=1 Tax=Selenomonas ruminantium TaxID=971 RepID=A0A1I0XK72_SELRU|nr:glycosyltransferase family 2 protein [Selenomonas ruminantium]SFB00618.1 Glycosyltransferase involved in cell wall bisynthesis [Selenomonas ruminantium]
MYKISIVTATYNSEKTIEQTITSVIRQDYNNIEYIVVDGKSTDDTMKIIGKYAGYGIKWISEEDSGIYDAFNKGIDISTGDYIYFLGSDDALYSKSTITNVVDNLEANIDVLSAAVMVVDGKSGKQYPVFNSHAKSREFFNGRMVPHQGMFCRTELLKKNKFDTKYKIAADYKLFLQLYFDDKVAINFIEEIVAFYADDGISNDYELCNYENEMICKELNISFARYNFTNKFKNYVKCVLKGLRILNFIFKIKKYIGKSISRRFIWEKHTCDNEICRWCRRGLLNQ